MMQRRDIRWVGWLLFALLWIMGASAASAAKSERKRPWFLAEKAAGEQRRTAPQTGFLLELELLPQASFLTIHTLPFLSFELGAKHLSLLGHADLHWSQLWLPTGPGGEPPAFLLRDGGSRVEVKYRWKPAQRAGWFHRELGLFWFPFSSAPFQMGEILETLWNAQPPGAMVNSFPVRLGVRLAWDWFLWESLVEIHWLQARLKEFEMIETVAAPAWSNRLRFRPHRMISFGVDGGFFMGGEHANVGVRGKPYVAWGVHPLVQLQIGERPAPIVFLLRRSFDPRAPRRSIEPLRTGKGFALTAEFALKGQHLQDPQTLTDLRWEMAYAFTTRARGQWGILSGELLFHWHNFAWTVFDVPGFVRYKGLAADANYGDFFLFAAAASVLVHRTVSLGARLELALPSHRDGPLPPEITGTPVPGDPGHVFVVRGLKDFSWLPPNTDVIVETKVMAHVRWEPWSFLSVMVEAWLSINPNQSGSESNGNATRRIVTTEHQFGTELLLQARFR